jgi:hypothetical protein
MERIAAESGIEIEFVRSRKSLRKEDRVKAGLEKRGEHPGVVCIFSPMEPRGSYQPWHDKTNHKMYLKPDHGKRPALLSLLHRRGLGAVFIARAGVGVSTASYSGPQPI